MGSSGCSTELLLASDLLPLMPLPFLILNLIGHWHVIIDIKGRTGSPMRKACKRIK